MAQIPFLTLFILDTSKQVLWLAGHIAQSVMCQTADTCLTADPGVASLIPVRSHTFVVIDHEIISTAIFLPSADSRMVVVSYKRKYVLTA